MLSLWGATNRWSLAPVWPLTPSCTQLRSFFCFRTEAIWVQTRHCYQTFFDLSYARCGWWRRDQVCPCVCSWPAARHSQQVSDRGNHCSFSHFFLNLGLFTCLCSRSLCHRGEGGGMSLNLSPRPSGKKRQKKRESEAGLCVPDSLGPGCFPPSWVCTCLPNKPPKRSGSAGKKGAFMSLKCSLSALFDYESSFPKEIVCFAVTSARAAESDVRWERSVPPNQTPTHLQPQPRLYSPLFHNVGLLFACPHSAISRRNSQEISRQPSLFLKKIFLHGTEMFLCLQNVCRRHRLYLLTG